MRKCARGRILLISRQNRAGEKGSGRTITPAVAKQVSGLGCGKLPQTDLTAAINSVHGGRESALRGVHERSDRAVPRSEGSERGARRCARKLAGGLAGPTRGSSDAALRGFAVFRSGIRGADSWRYLGRYTIGRGGNGAALDSYGPGASGAHSGPSGGSLGIKIGGGANGLAHLQEGLEAAVAARDRGRVYAPVDHFTRQLIIPQVKLSDWMTMR